MSENVRVCAFEGAQAAGRDIHNHMTLVQREVRESQLQAEFAERTGIWCSRTAREWLEHLMEHHGFVARELAQAWQAGSLSWDVKRDTPRFSTPWLESGFAWGVLTVAGLYVLMMVVLALGARAEKQGLAMLMLGGFLMLFVLLFACINRFMLRPRRVALRARRIGSHEPRAGGA